MSALSLQETVSYCIRLSAMSILLSDQLLVCSLSSNFEWLVSGNKTIQVGKLSMAGLGGVFNWSALKYNIFNRECSQSSQTV